jgi:hypothetical protein
VNFGSEAEFKAYVRQLIANKITAKNRSIYALDNKKAVDILICRDAPEPDLFFLEVKFHKTSHGRLGFGSSSGGEFQPEIVSKEPVYFESNLRWVIASEAHPENGIIFAPSDVIRQYVSGGKVGQKFNNIQAKIFREVSGLDEKGFVAALSKWVTST